MSLSLWKSSVMWMLGDDDDDDDGEKGLCRKDISGITANFCVKRSVKHLTTVKQVEHRVM